VRLRAALPLFLSLQGPRALARTARALHLTVASSLPATLVVRVAGLPPQRFAVERRALRLTVHVPQGRRTLNLRLTLAAGGLTRTAVLPLRRR
jgi:hypothetical protein